MTPGHGQNCAACTAMMASHPAPKLYTHKRGVQIEVVVIQAA